MTKNEEIIDQIAPEMGKPEQKGEEMEVFEAWQVICKDHIILALSDQKVVAMPFTDLSSPSLVVFDFSGGIPKINAVDLPQIRGRFTSDMACLRDLAIQLSKE